MYSIAYHSKYNHPLPAGHRFPMEKYDLLREQLLYWGIVTKEQFFEPKPVDLQEVYKVHDREYVDRYVHLELNEKEIRQIGFKQNQHLIDRELLLIGGTIQGALNSLKDEISFNIAGGTHHACIDHGEGFCMLNDQAIAAQFLIDHQFAQKILIIDLDVHQGNGTADIFNNRKDVFTFSMHCESNYPFRKKRSHLDIGLEIGTKDDEYLSILSKNLKNIENSFQADFIFYQSGVDILETDKMGKLKCTIEGCKERDRIVMNFAKSLGIPMQCSMGGGYSPELKTILQAHTNTFIAANDVFSYSENLI
ncbi:MAG TPA: histone deacetylase [Edaphocola sp.]|nr:histone deacetylase [Edaphocola sp.]